MFKIFQMYQWRTPNTRNVFDSTHVKRRRTEQAIEKNILKILKNGGTHVADCIA